ncbi:MAG TPA: tRNA 2-thiouridine(34) synthase MnmA [Kouleothrix sp.]|uniref:tRNA 2-thiouridine(34) synthase MnmA n=1 Tax=Kouleothrix sp. TaxID=2779161 RepID=UPI002BD991C7|nr:tRNA 2-thiouridine(34) synthase MnmA [Kouleothrix sp.]HRC75100.1 tRNA 2-thiouridine(34) synthase MnmA [Kouleothrix sp.]
MAKIMVAMSGGVDSSLVAALLHEAGHHVTGVTMHLWDGDDERLAESLCCSLEMTESARRVCAQLGIPYYVFNYQKEFRRHVIEYFLHEYAQGYTPNPCLACNRDIKFRALLTRAAALGFDYVATGHYARIRRVDERRNMEDKRRVGAADSSCVLAPSSFQLLRARDRDKDQSYMLHMLGQADLARLMFPIGEYSKPQVRALAAERGLASADRPESQDICFVPGGDYRNLLREERPESLRPGPIVDLAGREIGRHQGLPLYTIGQRRGLGVAAGEPLYVTALDASRNAVVVGPAAALERRSLEATQVTFVGGEWPEAPFECLAQIRSHADPVAAQVTPGAAGQVTVEFARPQRAVTPGQAVVLYDGEVVLGGGRISAEKPAVQSQPAAPNA